MSTDPTIARALELYSERIEVPVRLLVLRPRPPGERALSEGLWAVKVCECEDALRAFLARQQHFDNNARVLIEWVLDLARREAHAAFGEHVIRVDAAR